jgi:hypothetical protein
MEIKNAMRWALMLALIVSIVLLTGCSDPAAGDVNELNEVDKFFQQVQADPITIQGVKLGDSWRLVRDQAAYNDGEHRKEWDINLLTHPEVGTYKEYWVFDEDNVMMVFEGEAAGKTWDGYYEIFHQEADIPNKLLSIDYVYDGGEKQYTRHWTITKLTETELILTEENEAEDYFYQYTFRREKY